MRMRNYSYQHLDLAEKNYVSIPVRSDGVPLLSGFLEKENPYSLETLIEWCEKYPDASVALVCGKCNVYALDFDIDDHDVVEVMRKKLLDKDKSFIFRTVVGHGRVRFATVFRASKTLLDVSNATSSVFNNNGIENQIELIGNRIITVGGIHRKTGGIYHWDYPLTSVMSAELPILTLNDVNQIFNLFSETMISKGYKYTQRQPSFSNRRKEINDDFESVKLTKRYSETEVNELLLGVNGDTRDEWLRVGMALHAHYNGNVTGFNKWDEWSSQFDGYQGTEDCRKNWRSFHADGGVTMGSIAHKVKAKVNAGVELTSDETPLEFALNNFVYIAGTNEVGDLSKRVNESILPLTHMRNMKANVQVPVKTIKHDKVMVKYQPLMTVWMNHEDRKSAWSVEYVPNNERLINGSTFEGGNRREMYYNKYVAPVVKITEDTHLLKFFLEHIEYMFASDPDWVINWLAQIVQRPSVRYRTILYSIATHTGTGRGWLSELLGLLYGVDNVKTVTSMASIADPNAKNGYLDGSVLLIVNETDAPGKMKYNVGDRLKTMVSDDRQAVDVKYGKQSFNQQVYTRVFLQSNNIGNLVIDRNDNRIQPFINLSPPKEKEYYTRLYNLLNNPEFVNQVYTYLMGWKVDIKKLQSAHMTNEKRIVIESNQSPTASAFYEFVGVVGSNCFTNRQLNKCMSKRFVSGEAIEDEMTINHRELSHLLRENITFKKSISINGVSTRVFAMEVNDKLSWNLNEISESIKTTTGLIINHYGD